MVKKIKLEKERTKAESFLTIALFFAILCIPKAKVTVITAGRPSGTAETASTGETSQMIFHKTYASGMFGFISSIDLNRIGATIDNRQVNGDITLRKELAVKALLPICLGAFGASQSHALPHTKCIGLLAAISTTEKPVPNLISPIYPNGFEESIALLEAMGNGVKWWSYGEGLKGAKSTVQDVFAEILKAI